MMFSEKQLFLKSLQTQFVAKNFDMIPATKFFEKITGLSIAVDEFFFVCGHCGSDHGSTNTAINMPPMKCF